MTHDFTPRRGMVYRHHSGRVYTVLDVSNVDGVTGDPRDGFPATVHYVGANGATWSRPLVEFVQKFTVLYDGTTTEQYAETLAEIRAAFDQCRSRHPDIWSGFVSTRLERALAEQVGQ